MGKLREKKGLTLVEVVVVVVACAVILLILSRTRWQTHNTAFRVRCGRNLSDIGKAMLIYANDYDDEFPRAGDLNSSWAARTPNWKADARAEAYALHRPDDLGRASISSSLFLLVKGAYVEPKSFVCGGDKRVTEFKPRRRDVGDKKLTDLWDFGPNPPKYVSYAYHQVYSPDFPTLFDSSKKPIGADRNPWMDSPFLRARSFGEFKPDVALFEGTLEEAIQGNAIAHRGEGQNVLFLDSRVEFVKRSYCGLNKDNIYTSWAGQDAIRGIPPKLGSVPADRNDSLLVNDSAVPPSAP